MAGSQIIDVPGQGQVEFPAGMSDADIVTAIKKLSGGKSPDTMAGSVMQTPEERMLSGRQQIREYALGGGGQDAGRAAGLTARAAIKASPPVALGSMAGTAVDSLASLLNIPFRFNTPQALDRLLNAAGLPEPSSGMERIGSTIAEGMGSAGATAAAANLVRPAGVLGQGIQSALTSNLGSQVVGSGVGAGASGSVAEMGGGPMAQMAAGLAGGYVGSTAAQGANQTFNRVRQAGGGMPSAIGQSVVAGATAPFGLNNLIQNQIARRAGATDAEFTPGQRSDTAREGAYLSRETGIDLSPGEQSGNRWILGMENAARQYGPTADKVQAYDVTKAKQAVSRIESIADRISTLKVPTDRLGNAIQDTVESAVRNLGEYRNTTANRDYGEVRRIAGNQPVIKWDNLQRELQGIVDEYKNIPSPGGDSQKVLSQALASLRKITGEVEPGVPAKVIDPGAGRGTIRLPGKQAATELLGNTIDEAMRTRRFYGQGAKGKANIFEEVNPDLNRTLSSRLFRAIEEDFRMAPDGISDPTLRRTFEAANRNYGNISDSITYIEKSALGKLIGERYVDPVMNGDPISSVAGEKVLKALMTSEPSTRKASLDILSKHNPKLVDDIKAHVIRDALEKAGNIPPSTRGTSEMPISFAKFVTAIQGNQSSLDRQLGSYGFSPAEQRDIVTTVRAMTRAGDRTGYNASGTTPQSENIGLMGQAAGVAANLGTGALRAAAHGAYSIAGKIIGMNKIADAMTTQRGRDALKTIHKTSASPDAVISALAVIEGEKENE